MTDSEREMLLQQQPISCIPRHIGTYDEAASEACAAIGFTEKQLRDGGLQRLVE